MCQSWWHMHHKKNAFAKLELWTKEILNWHCSYNQATSVFVSTTHFQACIQIINRTLWAVFTIHNIWNCTKECEVRSTNNSMHRHWHRHRHQHASASASACIGIGISMHRQVLSSEPAQSFWAIRDRLELIKRRFRSNRQINWMYVAPEFAYWTLRPVRTINCPACCEIKG